MKQSRSQSASPDKSNPAMQAELVEVERFTDALWMERGLSDNTLAAYRNDLAGLAGWLLKNGKTLCTAQRTDLLDYLSHRVIEGARPRTTDHRQAVVVNAALLPLPGA
jgi:integrase/recombinase XerD